MVNRKMIEKYSVLKQALSDLKKEEHDMRISILEELFTSANIGTFNATVGDFAVKGIFKNNYRLDQAEVDDYYDQMSDEEKACINFKPTLLLREYNSLEVTKVIDECITVSPAMPTMTVKLLDDDGPE